ncbi:MAG: hypothetical protein ACRER3_13585 [Pseudomonas fluorescens]
MLEPPQPAADAPHRLADVMGGVEIKDYIKDVIKTRGEWISWPPVFSACAKLMEC